MLPLLIEPQKDELMYSYLWRLSLHNKLDISNLFKHYFGSNKRIRFDVNDIFACFFDSIDLPLDQVRFYLNHSIYAGFAPLISANQQAVFVAQAFRPNKNLKDVIGKTLSMINTLNICPLCQKEDRDKLGFWYYHREHHMLGVKMCPKHKTPLKIVKRSILGIPVRPFAENELVDAEVSNEAWELRYAQFASDFLKREIDADSSQTLKTIIQKAKELGLYDTPSLMEERLKKQGCNIFYDMKDVFRKATQKKVMKEHILALLVSLFDDVDSFKHELIYEPDKFVTNCKDGYEVLGNFYKPLLEMRKGNERFITTFTGFNIGWREYSADTEKTSSQKFEELFKNASDNTYELKSTFKGMSHPISVYHSSCNNVYSVTPRSFLIEGRRCKCERILPLEEAIALVEKHKFFKLIDYNNGTEKPCTIFHEVCGNSFKTSLYKFSVTPICRRCEAIKSHSAENIKNVVKDLVGDEYTVVKTEGRAKGKITLRHNKCNKEHTYLSKLFTEGSRCPYCNSRMDKEGFIQYVDEVTGGVYKIGKEVKQQTFEIITTKTKEVRIFKRGYILQELNRPTPSKVLPLEKKYPSRAMMNYQDIVWDFLINHYKPNDFILLDKLKCIRDVPEERIRVAMNELRKKGKVYRAFDGRVPIYSFHDVKLTARDAVLLTYVKQNDVRYGFLSGDSLLYSLKIISERPMKYTVTTNLATMKYKYDRRIGDITVNISPCPVLITEANFKTLQFIDLCYENKHKGLNADGILLKIAETFKITKEVVDRYLPYYSKKTQMATREILDKTHSQMFINRIIIYYRKVCHDTQFDKTRKR